MLVSVQAAPDVAPNAFLDAIPQELRQRVLAEAGLKDRRGAKLPLDLLLQLVVSMAFRSDLSISSVLEELVEVVGAPLTWRGAQPQPSSITSARDRLGWQVVRSLFREHAELIEGDSADQTWHGFHVYGLDGTTLRTPDTPKNEAAFGRPSGRNGPGGFPMVRCLALANVLTHQVRAAVFGPYKGAGTGELSLAQNYLLDELPTDGLLLMDRGFCSYKWLRVLQQREIPYVVRMKMGKNTVTPVKQETLCRGKDWLVEFPVPKSLRPRAGAEPLQLRMIKWSVPKRRSKKAKAKTPRAKSPKAKRAKAKKARKAAQAKAKTANPAKASPRHLFLLTTLTDDQAYPYSEIVQLYSMRWEIEFAFREIKTTLTNRKVEFRSKRPRRVLQEAYGLLLAYNAIRLRMAQAAEAKKLVPRRLSFTRSLHAVRRAYLVGSPLSRLLPLLGRYVLENDREPRSYARAVKCRSTRFPTKRSANAA